MTASPNRKASHFEGSSSVLMALTLAFAILAAFVLRTFEPELVLTAISVLLFLAAALAAIVARSIRTRRNTENVNLWDVAGGLVITGCAASVLGEPEHAAQLFEHLFERGSKSQ